MQGRCQATWLCHRDSESGVRCLHNRARASGFEVDRRQFAALLLNIEADLLAFVETIQSGALDRADMDKHVLAAGIRLDESETLGGVEPLDGACSHGLHPVRECGTPSCACSRQ